MGRRILVDLFAIALALGATEAARPSPGTSSARASTSSATAPATGPASRPATGPARWESEILAYEKKDKESPPPTNAVLFVGSSTIRMWKTLEDDFKPTPVVGRGVGGCQTADITYHAERIVIPYAPSKIVFYAGDNDIAAGRSARRVLEDFQAFVEKVRKPLPNVRIYYVSIKPSASRAKFWDEAKKANALIKEYAEKTPGLAFIDTTGVLLDEEGKPKAELFLSDKLHLNRQGYQLWIPIIRGAIERRVQETPPAG
jgi:lysophospholipase L1-like esterase